MNPTQFILQYSLLSAGSAIKSKSLETVDDGTRITKMPQRCWLVLITFCKISFQMLKHVTVTQCRWQLSIPSTVRLMSVPVFFWTGQPRTFSTGMQSFYRYATVMPWINFHTKTSSDNDSGALEASESGVQSDRYRLSTGPQYFVATTTVLLCASNFVRSHLAIDICLPSVCQTHEP